VIHLFPSLSATPGLREPRGLCADAGSDRSSPFHHQKRLAVFISAMSSDFPLVVPTWCTAPVLLRMVCASLRWERETSSQRTLQFTHQLPLLGSPPMRPGEKIGRKADQKQKKRDVAGLMILIIRTTGNVYMPRDSVQFPAIGSLASDSTNSQFLPHICIHRPRDRLYTPRISTYTIITILA